MGSLDVTARSLTPGVHRTVLPCGKQNKDLPLWEVPTIHECFGPDLGFLTSLLVSSSGSPELDLHNECYGHLASKERKYGKLIKKKGRIIIFISQMEVLMFRLIDLP